MRRPLAFSLLLHLLTIAMVGFILPSLTPRLPEEEAVVVELVTLAEQANPPPVSRPGPVVEQASRPPSVPSSGTPEVPSAPTARPQPPKAAVAARPVEAEREPAPEPERKAAPQPEDRPSPKPSPVRAEPEARPKPEPEPSDDAKPFPKPKPEVKPEPKPERKLEEVKPKPAEAKPDAKPEPREVARADEPKPKPPVSAPERKPEPPKAPAATKTEPSKPATNERKPELASDFAAVRSAVEDLRREPPRTERGERSERPGKPDAAPASKPATDSETPLTAQVAQALRSAGPSGNKSSLPVTSSEIDAVRRQIEQCWNPPAGAKEAGDLVVSIRVEMNADGTPRSAVVDGSSRGQGNPFFQAAAESARRAVLNPRCHPFKLPAEKFERWRTLTLVFNPKEMVGT